VRILEAIETAMMSGATPIQASHHKSKFGKERMSRIAEDKVRAVSRNDGTLARIIVSERGNRVRFGAATANASCIRRSLTELLRAHSEAIRFLEWIIRMRMCAKNIF